MEDSNGRYKMVYKKVWNHFCYPLGDDCKCRNLSIYPLHGPILSDEIPEVLRLYTIWSSYEPEDEGVFIAYASMHGNTAEAARKMKEILEEKGAKVAISDLSKLIYC